MHGAECIRPLRSTILIAFFILALSVLVSADCSILYNESVISTRKMPEYFTLKCSNLPMGTCPIIVDRFCLSSTDIDRAAMFSSLSTAEEIVFAKTIERLKKSANYLDSAKAKRNDAMTQAVIGLKEQNCQASSLILSINIISFGQLMGECITYSVISDYAVQGIIDDERYALEESSIGLNYAIEALKQASDRLYCEGGGYSNYGSRAAVVYDGVREFISKSNADVPFDPSRYSDVGRRWSSLVKETYDFESTVNGSGATQCQAATILSTSLGSNSIFVQIIELYRDVSDANIELRKDYEESNIFTTSLLKDAEARRQQMVSQQYGLITPSVVLYFRETVQETTLDTIPVPATSIGTISKLLTFNTLDHPSANGLKSYADSIVGRDEKFKYAIALENLNGAQKLAYETLQIANETDAFIESLVSEAENLTTAKRATADSAIKTLSDKGKVASDQLQRAQVKFATADALYLGAQSTKGGRLSALKSASEGFDESANLISSERIYNMTQIDILDQSINQLDSVIKLAKTDNVDVTVEETVLANKKVVLSRAALIAPAITNDVEIAQNDTRDATANIYLRASRQYAGLASQRISVLETIDLLAELKVVSDLRSKVSSFEGLIDSNGAFIPEKTLGKYAAIKKAYDSVVSQASQEAASELRSYLPKKVSANKVYSTVPIVDAVSTVTTYISITNDLPIGTNASFSITIPSVQINANSNITADPSAIRVASDGKGGATVFFPGLQPFSVSNIAVTTPFKAAETISKARQRTSLTVAELVERRDYMIRSLEDLNSLMLIDSAGADDCRAYVGGAEEELLFSGSDYSVRMIGVRNGNVQLKVICTIFNPIEITESNSTGTGNDVDYLVNIRSTTSDLDNVPISIQLRGDAADMDGSSIRALDTSGNPPKDYSYSKSSGKYYVQWKIPVLSSSQQAYRITFKVTDMLAYLRNLEISVINSSQAENIDVSSHLRDADYRINARDYARATESLTRAQRIIDNGRNARLQREAVANRLKVVSEKLSALKSSSKEVSDAVSSLGMSSAISEMNRQIADFDAKYDEADNLLSLNRTGESLALVKDLERMAESSKLESIFTNKQESLFQALDKLQQTTFTLSEFENTSDLIDAIDGAKSALKGMNMEFVSRDYLSAAAILLNVSTQSSSIEKLVSNRTDALVVDTAKALTAAKETIARWKSERTAISNAIKLSENNPGRRPNLQTIEDAMKDVEKKATDLSALYDTLKLYGKKDIVTNIDKFRALRIKGFEINDSMEYLVGLKNDYRFGASSSFGDARSLIEAKSKSAGTDMEKELVSMVQPLLSMAKDSYDAGMYLDSMILTDHIRNRLMGYVPPRGTPVNPLIIYIGVVVVASAAIVMLLFRKEEPKTPRTIERMKLD